MFASADRVDVGAAAVGGEGRELGQRPAVLRPLREDPGTPVARVLQADPLVARGRRLLDGEVERGEQRDVGWVPGDERPERDRPDRRREIGLEAAPAQGRRRRGLQIGQHDRRGEEQGEHQESVPGRVPTIRPRCVSPVWKLISIRATFTVAEPWVIVVGADSTRVLVAPRYWAPVVRRVRMAPWPWSSRKVTGPETARSLVA